MKKWVFVFALLGLASCASTPSAPVESSTEIPFIRYTTSEELMPVSIEGNKFYITPANCPELSSPSYGESFKEKLRKEMTAMGYVETLSDEGAYLSFSIACRNESDTYAAYDTMTSSKAAKVDSSEWLTMKLVDKNQIVISQSIDGVSNGFIKAPRNGKIMAFRFYAYQQKNKRRPQLVVDEIVHFAESPEYLNKSWGQLTNALLTNLEPFRNQAKANSGSLCVPRLGVEWEPAGPNESAHIVTKVIAGTAAVKAGLKVKDKVLTINGRYPRDFYDKKGNEIMEKLMEVPLQYERNGKIYTTQIRATNICTKK